MKWEVTDTKHNVANDTSRDYTIIMEATKSGNTLDVVVTVPKKPAKIKPVSWSNQEIKNWVKDKGFNISKTLTKNVLTNETENSKIYRYELVTPVPKPAPKQTKTRKKVTAGSRTTRASTRKTTDLT
jgi:hypothetical protein